MYVRSSPLSEAQARSTWNSTSKKIIDTRVDNESLKALREGLRFVYPNDSCNMPEDRKPCSTETWFERAPLYMQLEERRPMYMHARVALRRRFQRTPTTTSGLENDETNEFLSVPSSVSVMRVHCVTTSLGVGTCPHIYLNPVKFSFARRARRPSR